MLFTPERSATFELRDYQREARDAVLREWEKGVLSTLVTMATGTGKTEVLLSVLDAERAAGRLTRALILAHRKELVEQPVERAMRHFPALESLGIVRAEQRDMRAQIVAATVQTLSQERRLEEYLAVGPVSHLIIDEAHHGVAETYLRVAERFRAANPALRLLGATATPRGGAGARGLGDLFKSVAYDFPIRTAIKAKVLVPFEVNAVDLPVSFRDAKITHGDYQDGDVGRIMSQPNALAIVVKAWQKYAEGKPSLAFTATVEQAGALAATFRNAGVMAEAVAGTTPLDEREAILERFKRGEVPVVCNCQVFTEGVDVPVAACMVQCRPTRSDQFYLQMLGRILRLYPGKTSALVLDFVPEDSRNLFTAANLRDTQPAEQKVAGVSSQAWAVLADGQEVDGSPEELRVRILDYLRQDPLAWNFDGRFATTSMDAGRSVAVAQTTDGRYSVFIINRGDRNVQPWKTVESWEAAVDLSRKVVAKHGASILSDREADWRKLPASDKQKAAMVKMGIWKDGITRGQAAEIMTHEFARVAVFGWRN